MILILPCNYSNQYPVRVMSIKELPHCSLPNPPDNKKKPTSPVALFLTARTSPLKPLPKTRPSLVYRSKILALRTIRWRPTWVVEFRMSSSIFVFLPGNRSWWRDDLSEVIGVGEGNTRLGNALGHGFLRCQVSIVTSLWFQVELELNLEYLLRYLITLGRILKVGKQVLSTFFV